MRVDVYQKITDRIVQELELGVRPWLKPWSAGNGEGRIVRPLRANGIAYQGINVLMLWSEAIEKGYASPIWMTFKQALELGAHVRKGETARWSSMPTRSPAPKPTESGEEAERAIPFMKGYTVFNVGTDRRFARSISTLHQRRAANAFRASPAQMRSSPRPGRMSCMAVVAPVMSPRPTTFTCRCIDFFRDAESYYATLAHETTHWTRHETRLDRDFGRKRFGDEGYAMEELVAELGSAFLSADLELTPEVREDHAAYIGSWIKVLKNDKRAIFTAASHAQRAADFLNGLQGRGLTPAEQGSSPVVLNQASEGLSPPP